MERVRQREAVTAQPCQACGACVEEERCDACGAALRPGGYMVRRVLSHGASGRVYVVEDEAGRPLVLKEQVFALVPGAEQLSAFEREVEVLRSLSHPRIPKLLRCFREGTGAHLRLYLVQEYIAGQSLRELLPTTRFDEPAARDIARQVLEVLCYLHGLTPRVVHRDLKPDNLLRDTEGRLFLVDFGSARELRHDVTHAATLVGTFGYMPLEQLGGTVEPSSDLYALGATLIHLLSRKPPVELLREGMELVFTPHVRVSAPFQAFLARLVRPRAAERFRSAEEALRALEASEVARAPGSWTVPRQAVRAGVATAAVLGAAALWASGSGPSPGGGAPPRHEEPPAPEQSLPYSREPSWEFAPMGLYATGLALADIDRDGFADVIVSAGNDEGLQNLLVYLNDRQGRFPARPSWASEDADSNANLAVGDINGDGWLDVAVSVLGPSLGTGRVKVYFNHQGSLERRPSYESADSFSSFACALGDADGDGDLDLAVSVLGEGGQLQGHQRIYFNAGGRLEQQPSWKSSESMAGGGVKFADVQQDGVLDLVVGAEQTRLYAGALQADGHVLIPRTPTWRSEPGPLVPYVDVGPVGLQRQWGLVLSRNDVLCTRACGTPGFEAFIPSLGSAPVWRSQTQGLGSAVKLVDVNEDGVLDLVAGRWGLGTRPDGAPLDIFLGGEGYFSPHPVFSTLRRSQVQSIDAADLGLRTAVELTQEWTLSRPQAVLSLPHQLIGSLSRVELNGRLLGARDYASVPGASWLSFARRLQPGDSVRVRYVSSRRVDLAHANQDCDVGDYIYHYYIDAPAPVLH